jgi:AcrR family transcriptional regulator
MAENPIAPMDKIDPRIKRTRKLLGDALIALILEKGYAAITLKDITERADVAYITFFRHYRDKDELLAQRLQDTLSDLRARIAAAAREAQDQPAAQIEGHVIFEHVRANADLYRILLSGQGPPAVRQRTQELIASIFRETCEPLRHQDRLIPGEVAAQHIAAALLALIDWWVAREMPYTSERMAQIYQRLILEATFDALQAS